MLCVGSRTPFYQVTTSESRCWSRGQIAFYNSPVKTVKTAINCCNHIVPSKIFYIIRNQRLLPLTYLFSRSFQLENSLFLKKKREDSRLIFENITITRLNHSKLSQITNFHCKNNFKLPETNIFEIALRSQLQKLFILKLKQLFLQLAEKRILFLFMRN